METYNKEHSRDQWIKTHKGKQARLAEFFLNGLKRAVVETGQNKDDYRCPMLGPMGSKG